MVLEDNRQFHTPDVTPLYPVTLLDSCSPFTSPQKIEHQKFRPKYHRLHSNNNGCVVQYGISSNQLPGAVPFSGYQYDTQLVVKVSDPNENKILSRKNSIHCWKDRVYIKSTSPADMFIGKLTKSHGSWKDSSNKKGPGNNISDYYDKKPIRTLGSMFQEVHLKKETPNHNEAHEKTDSYCENDGSQIDTIAEVHKYDTKRRKTDKKCSDNDVEIMNEKNASVNQGDKTDPQKLDISKFKRQTMKLTKMFGGKDSQDYITEKDVEKADDHNVVQSKKKKPRSKTPDQIKDSEFSHIEEISDDYSVGKKFEKSYQNNRRKAFKRNDDDDKGGTKSVSIQATPFPPFRLHFLPKDDWRETDSKLHKFLKIVLSQCGLASIVLTWAMLGALVFRLTEGPQEQRQVQEMARRQAALVIGLATDLRQVVPQEPIWRQTIENYASHHESLILSAVSSGYPQRGTIWTYPGSLLFATSLLTTLGFGAPVPRTVIGRMSAVIFAGLGIPMHLLLILNIGLLIVVKLTRLANICSRKLKFLKFKIHKVKSREDSQRNSSPEWPEELFASDRSTPPTWLKFFPFVAIPTYYIIGFLLFGVARGKRFPEVFLFPLDFTAAGGVASTYGPLRIAYAMYLEGAVILASTNVALLRVSATRGFTTAAIKSYQQQRSSAITVEHGIVDFNSIKNPDHGAGNRT